MSKSISVEVFGKINFNEFRFAFEIAKDYYHTHKEDSNFIKAVNVGKQLLMLNKGFAEEMERRVGFNPSKDEEIAAFGFGIFKSYYQLQKENVAI